MRVLTAIHKILHDKGASGPSAERLAASRLPAGDPVGVPVPVRRMLCCGVTVLFSFVVGSASVCSAELPRDNDVAREVYFDGLRERGLYSLAETVCLTQLERSELTLPERTAIIIELSRTFAAHATVSATFDEQAELLQRARVVIDELLAGSARHPRRVLLEAQSAFVAASEVEVLRWQNELSPLGGESREKALLLSAGLLLTFDDLIERMTEELRNRPRIGDTSRLSPYRMRGLKRVAEYRLGMLLLDRARLFDARSPDRAETLLAARERFRDLAGGEPDETVTLQSQLGLITATRLSGDATAALRMAEAVLTDEPPTEIGDEAVAEKVESLLALGRTTDAADELREFRRDPTAATGRLLFLNVQVLLELAAIAETKGDSELAGELGSEAAAFAARAATELPGYWSLRARRLISAGDAADEFGTEAAPHIERGRSFFAAGQVADAIASYRAGWKLLRDSERIEQAGEIGYTLGSLLLNEGRFADAEVVLHDVATLAGKTPRAAQADFLRLFALARLYQRQPSRSRREAYVAALEHHRSAYPEAASFGDATWMLARLQELRLQTTLALRLYAEIPRDHVRHPEAVVATARCGETILDRLRNLEKPRADWEAAIMGELAEHVRPLTNSDAPLTPHQLELLLRTARMLLSFEQPDFTSADRLLDRVINAEPAALATTDDPPTDQTTARASMAAIQQTARALKVVSLSGIGQQLEARLLLTRIGTSQPESLANVLKVLGDASASRIDAATSAAFGELQVRAMERSAVDIDTLPIDRQIPLRLALADAHEQSRRPGAAARELAIVAQARPDDESLKRRLARLQLASGERPLVAKAKVTWRRFENQSKAGTNDWLEARRRVIECCVALGQSEEAARLLKVTRLLYPNGGTPETREALDRLATDQQSP